MRTITKQDIVIYYKESVRNYYNENEHEYDDMSELIEIAQYESHIKTIEHFENEHDISEQEVNQTISNLQYWSKA